MYFDSNNNYFDEYYITNNDNDENKDFDINVINFNRGLKLYSNEEGFNKGNLFQNLYSKYKNHVYKLKVNNKKDELLYKIQMYTFSLKDLILYLDIHPTDQNMIQEYHKIKNKLNELKDEYDKKYSPLCSNNIDSMDSWTWINNPWPWDKGGK